MADNKTVFLDSTSTTAITAQRSLPEIVEQIQDQFISQLSALLSKMLDKADDQLFDLADKAQSNQDQNLYFDSMRQLRIKRKGMEKVFSQELLSNFLLLNNQSGITDNSNIESLPLESLALVQKDELEENLAIDTMVSTAKAMNEAELRHIITRLDTLLAQVRIDNENNPLNPRKICEAFRIASKSLEFEIKSILIIYKLFDRLVVAELPKLYAEVNNYFIKLGVLPDLASQRKGVKSHTVAKNTTTLQNQSTTNSGVDLISALKSLNVAGSATGTSAGEHGLYNNQQFSSGAMSSGLVADLSRIDVGQLVQAVTSVQSNYSLPANDALLLKQDIRQQIGNALTIDGPVSSNNIDKSSDEIIDIVSMLFDFILDDNNLPDEFKAMIARLQIPMLKVALIDDSFFRKGSHPARKLINELAHAGVGWTKGGSIGLKDKVETVVTTIIEDFAEDISLFDELLADFRVFMKKHQKRAFLIERRLHEAEEGKARVESAILRSEQALKEIVAGSELPETIDGFIFNEWQNVLVLTCLREGFESSEWISNIQTVKKLISSLSPSKTLSTTQQKTASMKRLVKRIQTGFDIINIDDEKSVQLFNELKLLQNRVQQGERVIKEITEDNSCVTEQEINVGDTPLPEDNEVTLDNTIELSAVDQSKASDMISTPGSYFASSLIDSGPLHEDDEFMLLVNGLLAGAWFELNQDGKTSRCKLAAVINSIGKYIFVDYTGKKVAEYLKLDLALAFRRNEISQLDEGALFDRALTSIVANYRSQKSKNDGL